MKEESQILIYKGEDGSSEFQVKLVDNTIWLSQKQMSELFDKDLIQLAYTLKTSINLENWNKIQLPRNTR